MFQVCTLSMLQIVYFELKCQIFNISGSDYPGEQYRLEWASGCDLFYFNQQ